MNVKRIDSPLEMLSTGKRYDPVLANTRFALQQKREISRLSLGAAKIPLFETLQSIPALRTGSRAVSRGYRI
jgi:hypothetical protein